MANPDLKPGALAKPKRGSASLAREQADAQREANRKAVAKQVKQRDSYRCRWPEAHKCRGGPLEAAHIKDLSLRGVTVATNEITFCPWIHRRGPESIHGKELKVEPETSAGANGPCSFWRQTGEYDALGQPVYYLVARERAIGVVEKD